MHLHGTKVGLVPRKIVIDRDPATSSKGHSSSPTFRAMSTVAKRSPSQQLLSSYCLIVRHSFERYRDFANSAVAEAEKGFKIRSYPYRRYNKLKLVSF